MRVYITVDHFSRSPAAGAQPPCQGCTSPAVDDESTEEIAGRSDPAEYQIVGASGTIALCRTCAIHSIKSLAARFVMFDPSATRDLMDFFAAETPASQGATMSKHRNPRARLPKRSTPDNFDPGVLIALLYDDLVEVEALAVTADEAGPWPACTPSWARRPGVPREPSARSATRARGYCEVSAEHRGYVTISGTIPVITGVLGWIEKAPAFDSPGATGDAPKYHVALREVSRRWRDALSAAGVELPSAEPCVCGRAACRGTVSP